MAGGFADVLNVAGADALLAGADPVAGGSSSPVNQGFMGAMPELISSRDGSFSGESGKSWAEAQEHLPQLVQTVVLMHKHTSDVSEKIK